MNTTTSFTTNRKRLDELDAFRLIAAICVVIIHLSASAMVKFQTGSTLQLLVSMINALALFAVPAFIAISGLTTQLSYQTRSFKLGEFYEKKLLTLVLPYIIWTVIYHLYVSHLTGAPFNLMLLLNQLFYGTAFYHLYFMPIIFQFYLLYPLFFWLSKRVPDYVLLGGSLVLFVLYLGRAFPLFSHATLPWPTKAELKYADRFFMSYLPFYTLGLVLANNLALFKRKLGLILAVSLPLYLLSEYSHMVGRVDYFVFQKNPSWQLPLAWEISSFFAIILLLTALIQFKAHGNFPKWISTISGYTFTLYLAHPLILSFCEVYGTSFMSKSLTGFYGVTLILCISFPLLGSHLYTIIKKKWLN